MRQGPYDYGVCVCVCACVYLCVCACVYFTSEEVDEDDGCDQSPVLGQCGKGLVTIGCLWVCVSVCVYVCVCIFQD